jgi:hypothetical protein
VLGRVCLWGWREVGSVSRHKQKLLFFSRSLFCEKIWSRLYGCLTLPITALASGILFHFTYSLNQILKVKVSCCAPWRRLGGEVSVTPRPRFTLWERNPGAQWIGGWVSPRAGLKEKSSAPVKDRTSVVQSIVRHYWLSYPGSFNQILGQWNQGWDGRDT